MTAKWKIHDIIDLEYFLHQDSDEDEAVLDQRDRHIFTQTLSSTSGDDLKQAASDNREMIRKWLDARRRIEEDSENALLPGTAYADSYKTVKIVMALLGGVLGFLMATTLLRYSGAEPINVAYYLGVLVVPQLVLAVLMIFFLFSGVIRPSHMPRSALYQWIGRLLAKGIEKMTNRIQQKMTGAQRNTLSAILDLVRLKNKVYGKLFLWPVFILIQIFGVAFNTGILCGTLIRVLGTDLAFGWQTTLNVAPGAVHKFVQMLSLPWQWMVSDAIAHPGLEQIMGSRIILKEGIHFLATQDLASWWPFLCFCILFYGLLPRSLFLLLGTFVKVRLLKKLSFMQADCQRLIIRMTTPLVTSSGGQVPGETSDLPVETDARQNGTADKKVIEEEKKASLVLVPEDIDRDWTMDDLVRAFRKVFPSKNTDRHFIAMDMAADAAVLTSAMNGESDKAISVFLLMEAWKPPIRETLAFLRDLRSMLSNQEMMILGLVGKPHGKNIFTKATEGDVTVWKQKIRTLNDPFIMIERL